MTTQYLGALFEARECLKSRYYREHGHWPNRVTNLHVEPRGASVGGMPLVAITGIINGKYVYDYRYWPW